MRNSPFRQGGRGDGVRIPTGAKLPRNDRGGYKGCGVRRDTWVPPYSRAFCRAGPVCPAVGAVRNRRADRVVRPYGSATKGAMGGRPQGSPLRKRYKGCGAKRNPPVTAAPCQPPLGKGAEGTGVADCHSQCAHWLRNDRFYMGHGANGPSGTPAPTDRLQVMRWGGRPRGSPLRKNLYWVVTHKSFS